MISDDEVKDKSPSPADSDLGIQRWISPLFELIIFQVGPSMLLAAGHDCVPVMFAVDGANRISQGVKLEETK